MVEAADLIEWWQTATPEQRERTLNDNPWIRESPHYAALFAKTGSPPKAEVRPKQPRRREEDKLIRDIIDLAHLHGWLIVHPRPGRTRKGWVTAIQGNPGSPDLLLVHGGRGLFILAECKSDEGDLSPAQRIWRDAIREALAKYWYRDMPISYHIWRPRDWLEIVNVLGGK